LPADAAVEPDRRRLREGSPAKRARVRAGLRATKYPLLFVPAGCRCGPICRDGLQGRPRRPRSPLMPAAVRAGFVSPDRAARASSLAAAKSVRACVVHCPASQTLSSTAFRRCVGIRRRIVLGVARRPVLTDDFLFQLVQSGSLGHRHEKYADRAALLIESAELSAIAPMAIAARGEAIGLAYIDHRTFAVAHDVQATTRWRLQVRTMRLWRTLLAPARHDIGAP